MSKQSCFESECHFYLEEIVYKKCFDEETDNEEFTINCNDLIDAEYQGENKVKLLYKRKLCFDPEGVFNLTISFGVDFIIKKECVDKYDWGNIDITDELSDREQDLIADLSSRASLLVSEITASFGRPPIVTPPNILRQNIE